MYFAKRWNPKLAEASTILRYALLTILTYELLQRQKQVGIGRYHVDTENAVERLPARAKQLPQH